MKNLYLSHNKYLAALKHIRDQIINDNILNYYDDNTIGNKSTECTWGLCSASKNQWPDKEDYLFPEYGDNKVAVKYLNKGQHCPFDKDQESNTNPRGCFYRCKVFQHEDNLPNREEAIQLYNITIKKHDRNLC